MSFNLSLTTIVIATLQRSNLTFHIPQTSNLKLITLTLSSFSSGEVCHRITKGLSRFPSQFLQVIQFSNNYYISAITHLFYLNSNNSLFNASITCYWFLLILFVLLNIMTTLRFFVTTRLHMYCGELPNGPKLRIFGYCYH